MPKVLVAFLSTLVSAAALAAQGIGKFTISGFSLGLAPAAP
jgi:hypothetical protein